MAQLLTRDESIAAFEALRAELDAIRDSRNHKAETFIQSSQRVQAAADRGALLIGAVPISVDLAGIWRYNDRGILPEDGGAPVHEFNRRLFHYQGAAKRIVDILRDDVLWKLHAAPKEQPASLALGGTEPYAGSAHDRQYAALMDLVQPVLRLLEWSKRYITLLGDDRGVKSRIARSSHLEHFRSAGAELQASWSRHEPCVFDERVRDAFAAQRAALMTEKLARLTDADRDEWDNSVEEIGAEADRLDKALRNAITDYQRGAHLVSSGQRDADPEHGFMAAAIEEARKSRMEPNKTPLFVGAVVVKDGKIIARGHRGQHKLGEHAEYTTLERNLPNPGAAANATLYCTLEPCIVRNHPKSPCAEWIKRHRIARVVIGVIDPNRTIRGGGVKLLREAGIDVALFPKPFATEIEAMNSAFEREHALESGVQPRNAATSPPSSTKRRAIVLVTFAIAVLAAIGTVVYLALRRSESQEPSLRPSIGIEVLIDGPLVLKDDNAQLNLNVTLSNHGQATATHVEIVARMYQQEFARSIFTEPVERQAALCDEARKEPKPKSSRLTLMAGQKTSQNLGVGMPNIGGPIHPIVIGCVTYWFEGARRQRQTRFIYELNQAIPDQPGHVTAIDLTRPDRHDKLILKSYFFGGWDAD